MIMETGFNHKEIAGNLERELQELPTERKAAIYEIMQSIYEDFSLTLQIEQANALSTGLSQAMYGVNALNKINVGLPEKYSLISQEYNEMARKLRT